MADCSHVFRDGNKCVKCGTGVARLLLNERAEWALVTRQLRADLARVTESRNTSEHSRIVAERQRDAARAETARLRERVAEVLQLWADFSSQEMYGETFSDGMEEQDYEAWCEALQALTSDPEPTT